MCDLGENEKIQIGEIICLSGKIENKLKVLARRKFGVSCLRVFKIFNFTNHASFSSCIGSLFGYLPIHLTSDLHNFKNERNRIAHGKSFSDLSKTIEFGNQIFSELLEIEKSEKSFKRKINLFNFFRQNNLE
ncbi:hypothetical protein ThvES_00011780 [Thiovulum sp. ES]|nr:hypothetical protein ThvES_00011780 [Thiovulum sp. ES]